MFSGSTGQWQASKQASKHCQLDCMLQHNPPSILPAAVTLLTKCAAAAAAAVARCCCHPAQVFDEELQQLEDVIRHLATAGVDALIVQVCRQTGKGNEEW
jgi:hypothetical protein